MATRRDFLKAAGGVTAAAFGVGCSGRSGTSVPAGPADLLYVEIAGGLAVVDARRRALAVPATRAIASADWSRLYLTRREPGGAALVTLEAATGRELSRVAVASGLVRMAAPGGLAAQAVSAAGRLVALADPGPGGRPPYRPISRRRSTIVVADPTGARRPRRLVLDGNYEVDAFSADDRSVFVLQYLPATAPDRYRVRVCDLSTGTVGPLLTRTKAAVPPGAEEEMRGEGRQAVLAPSRDRLYTLYTHQPEHQHTRDLLTGHRRESEVHAFVHVLSLTEGWAYCVDLPEPFGRGPAAAHTLALAPDGSRLFVADMSTGRLVVADTEQLQIIRTVRLGGQVEADAPAAAQVAPDGTLLFLGAGERVRAVDLAALTVTHTLPVSTAVRGLAVGPRLGSVYVGQRDHIVRLDVASGREVGRLAVPGLAELRHARAR